MTRMHLLSLLVILAGCTPTMTPDQAMQRINGEFSGHDIGEFFVSYGSAAGVKTQNDGSKLYHWVSIEPHSGSNLPGYINYPGGHYVPIAPGTNGEILSGYCEINIATTRDDRIQKLTLISDSIGKYSGSRCAEIFEQGPN